MSTLRVLLLATLAASPASPAEIDVFPTDDLRSILLGLSAGDRVTVHAGTYSTQSSGGSWFFDVNWAGTPAQPIIVRAAAGDRPILQGDPSENVINIDGSYFVLRGFEITGGSHGLRLGDVDNATLEDLRIHDIADVGISCNRPAHLCDTLTIRRNEIYSTGISGNGEGMYLGCNASACAFTNSLVELNYIHDLGGDQGDGIEIKTGSYSNIVRDNVVVGAKFPGITMYGFTPGAGRERNLVDRNFVWNSTLDNGIQVVGQVIVRNNIVVGSAANGIHSKSSQGFDPVDMEIVHNTIYQAGSSCLKSNDWGTANAGIIVANNAVYCPSGSAINLVGGDGQAANAGNVALGSVSGLSGVATGVGAVADLGDPDNLVFWPPATSALIAAGSAVYAAADDFNGSPRPGGDVEAGAYERVSSTNPGWTLQAGFKDAPGLFSDGFESGDTSNWAASVP